MLATHRIRIDLDSDTGYVVALALQAMSEICTADMCRELSAQIIKLIKMGNNYLKKKAILAATRVIRKLPEAIPLFIEIIPGMMESSHNGFLTSIQEYCSEPSLSSKTSFKSSQNSKPASKTIYFRWFVLYSR